MGVEMVSSGGHVEWENLWDTGTGAQKAVGRIMVIMSLNSSKNYHMVVSAMYQPLC